MIKSSPTTNSRCSLSLNVSTVDSLAIQAIPPLYDQPDCDMTSAVKFKGVGGVGRLICKGVECLGTALDVSQDSRTIRILHFPTVSCTFTWKISGVYVNMHLELMGITGNARCLPVSFLSQGS